MVPEDCNVVCSGLAVQASPASRGEENTDQGLDRRSEIFMMGEEQGCEGVTDTGVGIGWSQSKGKGLGMKP